MGIIREQLSKYDSFFDGITDDLGVIVSTESDSIAIHCWVNTKKLRLATKNNDMVLINGLRGRVTGVDTDSILITLDKEKYDNYCAFFKGEKVNLQKEIINPDPIRAQLVTGDIDGIGNIVKINEDGKYIDIWISYPKKITPYLFEMGYICVDGVCLTIKDYNETEFKISIFPKTKRKTSFGSKTVGGCVNIESSITAKVLEEIVTEAGCVVYERNILSWLVSPY